MRSVYPSLIDLEQLRHGEQLEPGTSHLRTCMSARARAFYCPPPSLPLPPSLYLPTRRTHTFPAHVGRGGFAGDNLRQLCQCKPAATSITNHYTHIHTREIRKQGRLFLTSPPPFPSPQITGQHTTYYFPPLCVSNLPLPG